ncbi:hypothetical protein NIES4101_66220 [Calothrix sp. NIES-4101]|nr:hypothetical protein NIES4101_66220 [Calothrix sp. NIES-4101]
MIISDLNLLETVEASAVIGGGGVNFKSKIEFDKNVKIKQDFKIKSKLDSDVDVDGNYAGADATADAFGKDTFSYTITGAQVNAGKSSESFSQSVAATDSFSIRKR